MLFNFRQITHLFLPYSQNTIINSECRRFSVELKVGTPIGDYRLPVVTGAAEPQEGGGIARAWIEDPKVVFVVNTIFLFFVFNICNFGVFVVNTC